MMQYLQYANLILNFTAIAYFVKKFHGIEDRVEDIVDFLHTEKVAAEERRENYESDLNVRLETLQKMRFSPLRIVPKREQ